MLRGGWAAHRGHRCRIPERGQSNQQDTVRSYARCSPGCGLGIWTKIELRLNTQLSGSRQPRRTAVCISVQYGMCAAIETYPVSEPRALSGSSGQRPLSADSLRHPQLTLSIAFRCFKELTLPTHSTLCRTRHHLFGTLAVNTIGRWENQPPFGRPTPAIAEGCETSPCVRTSGSDLLHARLRPDCMNLPTAKAQPIGRKTLTRIPRQTAVLNESR